MQESLESSLQEAMTIRLVARNDANPCGGEHGRFTSSFVRSSVAAKAANTTTTFSSLAARRTGSRRRITTLGFLLTLTVGVAAGARARTAQPTRVPPQRRKVKPKAKAKQCVRRLQMQKRRKVTTTTRRTAITVKPTTTTRPAAKPAVVTPPSPAVLAARFSHPAAPGGAVACSVCR